MGACGKLCGESFNEANDPSSNTSVQRTWLYASDPAIKNIHLGGKRPEAPRKNNELSLPTGDGAMATIRADLKKRGSLYRVATTVTKGLDKRPGINVFRDAPGVA